MRRRHTVIASVLCLSAAAASLVGDRMLHERCCSAPSARSSGVPSMPADASLQPVRFSAAGPEDATLLASPASAVMCLRKAYGKSSSVLEASAGGAGFGTVDDYAESDPAAHGTAKGADAIARGAGGDPGAGPGGGSGGVPSGLLLAGVFGFSGGLGGGFGGAAGGEAGAAAAGSGAVVPRALGQGGGSSTGSTGGTSGAAGAPTAGEPTTSVPVAGLSLAGGGAPAGSSPAATADPLVVAQDPGLDDRLRMPDIVEFRPEGALPTAAFDPPAQQVRANLAVSPVPEPGSLALVLLGLGVVGLVAWRSAPRILLFKR